MNATEGIAQVNELATHTAMTLWNVASDFLIILVLFAVLFVVAWYVGRATLVSVILAFYAAYAVYVVFPYTNYLSTLPAVSPFIAHIGLYALLALLFYSILQRVVVSDFVYIGIIGLTILSLLGATFLIALAYHTFPVAEVYRFTPAIDALFAAKQYFFWWFIAPAVGLFFFAH